MIIHNFSAFPNHYNLKTDITISINIKPYNKNPLCENNDSSKNIKFSRLIQYNLRLHLKKGTLSVFISNLALQSA